MNPLEGGVSSGLFQPQNSHFCQLRDIMLDARQRSQRKKELQRKQTADNTKPDTCKHEAAAIFNALPCKITS